MLALLILAGCSAGSTAFTPEEGSAEAAIVNHYSQNGITVTDVEVLEQAATLNADDPEPTLFDVAVTATTDMDEEGIKEAFIKDGIPDKMHVTYFGEAKSGAGDKTLWVKKMIINGDEYTFEALSVVVDHIDGLSVMRYYSNVMTTRTMPGGTRSRTLV